MLEQAIYTVPETLKDGEIAIGVATSIEDQIGRLGVVTERYNHQGYLANVQKCTLPVKPEVVLNADGLTSVQQLLSPDLYEAFEKEGLVMEFEGGQSLYVDKYHWNSVPIVAKTNEGYVGSARVIVRNGHGLPTLTDPRIQINEEWQEKANACPAEFSQFAVKKGSPPGVSVGILRNAHLYSRDVLGLNAWVATTDNFVVKLLNGSFFHFSIPTIGPSVDYLGSSSTPTYLDFEKSLDNAQQYESSAGIARFIRGENGVDGFQWYQGI
ncbi:MAG: hypothetical protein WCJ58_03795 [bacterium]